jgi:hypothetical protein
LEAEFSEFTLPGYFPVRLLVRQPDLLDLLVSMATVRKTAFYGANLHEKRRKGISILRDCSSFEFGYGKVSANLMGKDIFDFIVPWIGFYCTCGRIHPQRMTSSFSL